MRRDAPAVTVVGQLASLVVAAAFAGAPMAQAQRDGSGEAAGSPPAAAAPAPRAPTLGAHAAILEGTWELVAMTLPDGAVLKPPVARGVIVIDNGMYLAASYLQPPSARTVGSIWEGQLIIHGDRFDLVPHEGYRYDSTAEQRVHGELPPPVRGAVTRTDSGLVFAKDEGGRITFPAGANRRVQEEADGTVIEHARTSLVPRVPDDLPGRPAAGPARP